VLNAPNLGQVTTALIAPPATPQIGKVIEGHALPEPQVEKPEPDKITDPEDAGKSS
jgi:hypothetical protein